MTKGGSSIVSVKQFFRRLDHASARIQLRLGSPRSSLTVFLFHALFPSRQDIELNLVDPQGRITTQHLRDFIEYYLDHGCTFVSPDDVLRGLGEGQHILMTFDDGYYNNRWALPLLHSYNVPALFFVSTDHVIEGKCFWWDVLYRERLKSGNAPEAIEREGRALWSCKSRNIEQRLKMLFGETALQPVSDLDRPFTPAELRDFCTERGVYIGNHTADHAILTNYSREEARLQIVNAQRALGDITGVVPDSISYPHGRYSEQSIEVSKESGLKLGITVDYRKNFLPLQPDRGDLMRLGRVILNGNERFMQQCETFRSDIWFFGSAWHSPRS